MNESIFSKTEMFWRKSESWIGIIKLCNKTRFKNATKVDISKFAKKVDLANLKSDVDKLDIDKLAYVPTNLTNLKSKVDKLVVDKLVPVPLDLSKLSDVVKNVFDKDVYNAKIKNIEDKISDITNLATNTTLNAKINEAKGKIPSITNLATNTALKAKINEVKGKIPSITNLFKNTVLTTVENKIINVSNLDIKTDYNTIKLERQLLLIMILINILLLKNWVS